MNERIEPIISDWDGKSTGEISSLFDELKRSESLVNELVPLLEMPSTELGASWLLKRHLETGGTIDESQIDRVYALFPIISENWTKVHLLQIVEFMFLNRKHLSVVEPFVREGLNSKHKLIRAWSINAFAEIAKRFPEYKQEAKVIFADGLQNGSAAVKARVRNLLQKGD